jgi:tRNA-intron endonuclease
MVANGKFLDDRVIVGDEKEASQLYNKGRYGALSNKKLELSLMEALYLVEKGSLQVLDGRSKVIDYDRFLKKARKREPRFWIRFSVYRNIRSKGYITKTALKYGADFRVYGRGQEPGKSHAKWILYAVSENEQFDWKKFAAMNRVAHSVRKKLMVGILDDEGDVTYYQVSWMKP